MFIYTDKNVFEAAKERISYLFDEFETVIVSMSGGKDSCVVFNLCLEEAERRGRLPLPVLFLDQEAEWQMTIDYIKKVMYDPRVKPYWIQCPVRLFNATSHEKDNWLFCWREGDKWMREKDPIAIKENKYGVDRFGKLLDRVVEVEFPDVPVANVAGIRCEESPGRRAGLTGLATYKHITWGAATTKDKYVFSPIYDWSYTDVWKAIFDNKWDYNKVYDYFYRYGVPVTRMRVSNLNHETAVSSLYHLQEIEPETWNKICERINGVDTTAKISYKDNFQGARELPFMFENWKEYRDYLLDHLVGDEEQHERFKHKFDSVERKYFGYPYMDKIYKVEITEILANDYFFTKLGNYLSNGMPAYYIQFKNGRQIPDTKEIREMIEAIKQGEMSV